MRLSLSIGSMRNSFATSLTASSAVLASIVPTCCNRLPLKSTRHRAITHRPPLPVARTDRPAISVPLSSSAGRSRTCLRTGYNFIRGVKLGKAHRPPKTLATSFAPPSTITATMSAQQASRISTPRRARRACSCARRSGFSSSRFGLIEHEGIRNLIQKAKWIAQTCAELTCRALVCV
jgi:hypothetical protein